MLSFPRSSRATPFAAQPGPHDTDSLVDRDHTPPGCAAQPTSQQRHSATPAPHQGRPCPSTSPTSDPHPAGRITATLATGITPPGQQRRHPFTLTQRPSVSTVVCAHDGPTNTTATARRPRQRPQQPRDQPLDTVNPPFRPPRINTPPARCSPPNVSDADDPAAHWDPHLVPYPNLTMPHAHTQPGPVPRTCSQDPLLQANPCSGTERTGSAPPGILAALGLTQHPLLCSVSLSGFPFLSLATATYCARPTHIGQSP